MREFNLHEIKKAVEAVRPMAHCKSRFKEALLI